MKDLYFELSKHFNKKTMIDFGFVFTNNPDNNRIKIDNNTYLEKVGVEKIISKIAIIGDYCN